MPKSSYLRYHFHEISIKRGFQWLLGLQETGCYKNHWYQLSSTKTQFDHFNFPLFFFFEIYEISLVGESRKFVISRLVPGKLNLKLNQLTNHAEKNWTRGKQPPKGPLKVGKDSSKTMGTGCLGIIIHPKNKRGKPDEYWGIPNKFAIVQICTKIIDNC